MSSLINLLESQIADSDVNSSQDGEQRERNHRYYAMQPLGNEREGYSQYVDPSVFESVEDKKAVYSESFLSSRQVVRFNGTSQEESAAKSAYVQRVLRANNYTDLFRDGWHDAFVAKRMTVWVDWKRDREEVTLQFMGAPSAQVSQELQQLGEIVSINRDQLQSFPIPSIGPQQFIHTGLVVVQIDKSYIDLELVQPEYVMRDQNQTYARDAMWNSIRKDMSKLMLINWGFDPDQVDKLDKDYRWGSSDEDTARKSFEGSQGQSRGSRLGDQEEVTIYKTRTWLTPEDFDGVEGLESFEPEPSAAIYEIYWGHGKVLMWNDGEPAVKIVEEMWVYEWSEFKVSHAANSLCTADVEAHQQKASSGLKRGVMDNMNITNNPRYEANTDGLKDPRDLFDNAIGGVIETDGLPVGQIKALEQPQLSPLVFGVIQMLDRDSEARKGMSELATGMNMGAVNNQNADRMIERLTAAGARRVAMGVRDFANTFLIPMLQCIVKVGMQYDKSQSVMESGGKQIPISPSQWSDDLEMEIEVALTPEEAQNMTMRLLAIDARINADPDMKPLYGLKQKHALWDTVYELMGVKDSTKFLVSPESAEVQQSIQMMQQQAQEAQKKADDQIAWQKLALQDQLDLGWASLNNKILDVEHDNKLDDKKFVTETVFRGKELQLEQQQERNVSLSI